MARRIGLECPPVPLFEVDRRKGIDGHYPDSMSCTFPVDVITPLFGGGAEPGEIDPISVVRAPSVRGHLRFWWRATRGLQFTRASDLRDAEAKVWGSASSPSPVILEISIRDQGREVNAADLRRDPSIGYAVFPFQENKRENRLARAGREGVKFDVTLRFPLRSNPDNLTLNLEVMTAVWAWTNFGGVGARTRRGLGALRCPAFWPRVADREGRWLAKEWSDRKLPESGPRAWPVLAGAPLHSAPVADPRQAWARALHQLREFRQGYGTGRGGSPHRPGRSFWPEADSLRMITRHGEYHHMNSLTVDEPAFPRAALGMPIVMHFKGREDSPNNCIIEPEERGVDTTRMSSPIILRPLATADGKYVAMVLRLEAQKPSGVRAKFPRDVHKGGSDEIERPDLAVYPNSPMKGTKGSALEAFMNFARKNL